jgi:hypothetical protein
LSRQEDADIYLSLFTEGELDQLVYLLETRPKPTFIFIWDFYFENRQQDDSLVARLLKPYKDYITIMCPNAGSKLCLESFGFTNVHCVRTFAQYFEGRSVCNRHYVCFAQRQYPWDMTAEWGIRACTELNIPYMCNRDKRWTFEQYKDILSGCSFIATTNNEASTGGMSLLEAYNLGKPVLFPNSVTQGANDIFQDRGYRYQFDSYDDLCYEISQLWMNPPDTDLLDQQAYCSHFSGPAFAGQLKDIIK